MNKLIPLLAVVALSACAPTRADVAAPVDALAPSGGDSQDAWFALTDPIVVDEGGDGVWDLGEAVTLHFTFTNQREDHYWYPGVLGSTDVDEVVAIGGENWWYGLEAGGSYDVQIRFEASPDLDAGSTVTLIASASSLACNEDSAPEQASFCPDPNSLLVPIRLGFPLP